MKKHGLLLLLLGWLLFVSLTARAQEGAPNNVILLMLDGVRWQEVFNGVDREQDPKDGGEIFSFLWKELAPEGVIFGNRDKGSAMTVSNGVSISLPAYQSIMAGETQPCHTNSCGRIGTETVEERIRRELGLERHEVATIASWEQIPNAVEHVKGATFVNAAFEPLQDGTDDPVFAQLNEAQSKDRPSWDGARFDRYTFAHAMRYLDKYHPRFMFISLNDSDEWGHKGNYPNYVATLRQYDRWIHDLTEKLKEMGSYGANTTLIVTTDHGRGEGGNWKHHGWFWPSSKYVWLYGKSPYTGGQAIFAATAHAHIDIRPTIEAAMGLVPRSCKSCGTVMSELIPHHNTILTER